MTDFVDWLIAPEEPAIESQAGSVAPSPQQDDTQVQPAPKVRLSTLQDVTPRINKEKIDFVLDQLPKRGPVWARDYMERVEGFERWPRRVQQAVLDAEREAAQFAEEKEESHDQP